MGAGPADLPVRTRQVVEGGPSYLPWYLSAEVPTLIQEQKQKTDWATQKIAEAASALAARHTGPKVSASVLAQSTLMVFCSLLMATNATFSGRSAVEKREHTRSPADQGYLRHLKGVIQHVGMAIPFQWGKFLHLKSCTPKP